MRTIKIIIVAFMTIVLGGHVNGQVCDQSPMTSQKTDTISVSGNCNMCKARIEKAAMIEGVSTAVWDKKTEILTVTYHSDKVTPDSIAEKLAAVGHDTPKFKADTKIYEALPGCCKYR